MSQAYRTINEDSQSPILLICDHATNHVPEEYDNLGLSQADLDTHIAWDKGAADLVENLATRLKTCAVFSAFSRLVIDANRPPDHPDSILAKSHGIDVPGNHDLNEAQITDRQNRFLHPYHREITKQMDRLSAAGQTPMLVGVHSFTGSLEGVSRPWQIGVLWDDDDRMADFITDYLTRNSDYSIGENQPYSAKLVSAYSISRHCLKTGLPHVILEVREDVLETEAQVDGCAKLIEGALRACLESDQINRPAA